MANKRASVLIVDDNDLMRTLLRGILRGEEYDVAGEARNGAAAVEMSERLKPDIVCLDVMMPEMDGLEALQAIKAAQPDISVVMISGNASADNVREALAQGAAGFIVKPFNAARVIDTLDRVRNARASGKTAGE